MTFAAEIRRRQQLGTLVAMDMGRLTLSEYVDGTWRQAYASQLSPKTRMHYDQLLAKHILPSLGGLELRAIQSNPARAVRKAPLPRRSEVRPLAPDSGICGRSSKP